MTAQPAGPATGDRAASDAAALVPTPTAATGPVTARDISELLAHLARLRVGAPGNDPAERAAFLARKADLLARIADPDIHPDTGPASTAPEGHTP